MDADSGNDGLRELDGVGKLITKTGLDLACSSEKLENLSVLKMHVETRENYFEAIDANDPCSNHCADKALEFDLLSSLLDSEVRELRGFLSTIQMEIDYSRQIMPTIADEGEEHCRTLKEKLDDSQGSLKHLQDQLIELEAHSSHIQKVLSKFTVNENCEDLKALESLEVDSPSTPKTEIKMQQRQVLQMLEKSLANELDLEKKLSETKQSEEGLKLGLAQQISCVEIEVEDACESLFGAEYAAQVLLGASKELRSQLQNTQLDLTSTLQREEDLKSQLKDLNELLSTKESLLQELILKVHELEAKMSDVMEKNAIAERRLQIAEAECKSLRELNKDLTTLTNNNSITSNVNSTIEDMENVIESLNMKVIEGEEKCIILSEANADLNNELEFLKCRTKCLEASLHQAEETKKATARDINFHAKLIADLIMQLTLERERLHKQVCSMRREQKASPFQRDDKEKAGDFLSKNSPKGNEEVTELSLPKKSMDNQSEIMFNEEGIVCSATRDIDARQLMLKHFLAAALFILAPPLLALLYHHQHT